MNYSSFTFINWTLSGYIPSFYAIFHYKHTYLHLYYATTTRTLASITVISKQMIVMPRRGIVVVVSYKFHLVDYNITHILTFKYWSRDQVDISERCLPHTRARARTHAHARTDE